MNLDVLSFHSVSHERYSRAWDQIVLKVVLSPQTQEKQRLCPITGKNTAVGLVIDTITARTLRREPP
jgi:hypothetical protein